MQHTANDETVDKIVSQQKWLKDNLISRIFHLANALQVQSQALIACECDLTTVQYRILLRLHLTGPDSVQEIAYLLGTDQSNVSRTLPSLLKGGWIETELNPNDRRQSIIKLTQEGEDLAKRAGRGTNARMHELHAQFDDQELKQLLHYMNRMDQVLAKPAKAFAVEPNK